MIFFRYQNTKTLERNSKYVDMRMLYNESLYRLKYSDGYKSISLNTLVDYMYPEFSDELQFRANLEPSQYRDIISKVCKIAMESLDNLKSQSEAYEEIDELMSPYPLKGIFVVPECCEKFPNGTKYSVSELRSQVICSTYEKDIKYLAIYAGKVLSKEMTCGGTLITPTKILGVLPMYKNAKKISPFLDSINQFYRDIEDENDFKKALTNGKNIIKEFYKSSVDCDILSEITFNHIKEVIIRKALSISKCNYKDLNYRFKDERHLIEITGKNKLFKFCIFNSDICINDFLSSSSLNHKGFYVIEDLLNNITVKERLNFDLAV